MFIIAKILYDHPATGNLAMGEYFLRVILPKSSPELNPDEQVWNEIKDKKIGRQPVKNKTDLRERLYSALNALKHQTEKVRSFFELPHTKYASVNVH